MQITDLKVTKKGRIALFCDDIFYFSLSPDSVAEHGLEIGDEIDTFLLSQLSKEADYSKAMDKALTYLDIRMHTRKEIVMKLRKNFDEITADAVADKLEDYGYINDTDFADTAFHSLFERKQMSSRGARQYLYQRGIRTDDPVIAPMFEEFSEGEVDRIVELIGKKYRDRLGTKESADKVIASLARKGFSLSDIRKAIARINEEIEVEYDE